MNKKNREYLVPFILLFLSPTIIFGQTWIDRTFEDFSKGTLDASGQNIYVIRKGGLRTIRNFDINKDGYIDLMFNSTHDDDTNVPASFGSFGPNRGLRNGPLRVAGSIAAEIADLNKDGFPDIVFCPNQSGIQNSRGTLTIIWGGSDGWPDSRSNGLLPVNGAKSIATADIDRDGWTDVVTLNSPAWLPNQPDGNIVRIYWGSEDGFILNSFTDIGIEKASKLFADDFDNDGFREVAALTDDNSIAFISLDRQAPGSKTSAKPDLTVRKKSVDLPDGYAISIASGDLNNDGQKDLAIGSDKNSIIILKGDGKLNFSGSELIGGVHSSSITVADLDGDKSADLITSKFTMRKAAGGEMLGGAKLIDDTVQILWGNGGQFSAARATEIDAPYTASTAVFDVDGDGNLDIVSAKHQGEKEYRTDSTVFFGQKDRRFEKSRSGIPTSGASHVAVIPKGAGNETTLVFSNSRSGTLREEVPLYLYYGGKNGFDANNKLEIPFRSGYESSAADLNSDGYVDLIAVNSMHARETNDPFAGVNIFWGGKDGFDITGKRTVLTESNASTTNVADLNKDGYLDITVGLFNHPDKSLTHLIIYYGSEAGYEKKNRVAIPSEGRSGSPNIADYNNDGWLDIAVTSYIADKVRVFYGSPGGFSEKNQKAISIPTPIDLETADLNNDGFADLIVPTYRDHVNYYHDLGVLIVWGNAKGFAVSNAQLLPSWSALGPVAADFDADGYLDLFLPAYLGDNNREAIAMYLYWGSKTGYSEENRTVFFGDSGTDSMAADFNNDGKIDLVIAEHARNGGHSKTNSRIYYNDGKRFSSRDLKVESLPTPGTHWMWNYDVGHIMTRKFEQTYTSQVFNVNKNSARGNITADAQLMGNGFLKIQVRSATDAAEIENRSWETVENSAFRLAKDDRVFQYKLVLASANGDNYPAVNSVSISIK
ncbi:MAG: VCBS repeat-containing protein [Pyrinomonadaceae bacterium]